MTVRRPFLAQEINPSVGEHRRRGEVAAEALHPVRRSGRRVEARRDPAVVDDEELVADEQRRGRQRRAALQRPRDVRLGDVAGRRRRAPRCSDGC